MPNPFCGRSASHGWVLQDEIQLSIAGTRWKLAVERGFERRAACVWPFATFLAVPCGDSAGEMRERIRSELTAIEPVDEHREYSRMMRRSAIVALLVAAGVAAAWYRARSEGDWFLERRLSSLIERSGDKPFAVVGATNFEWEELHIFRPYEADSAVDRRLGFSSPVPRSVGLERRDDIALLVFVKSGQVVAYVAQPRKPGDFTEVPDPAYTPQTALFRLKPRNGWPYLEPVSDTWTEHE
jgi:hypothetical protein